MISHVAAPSQEVADGLIPIPPTFSSDGEAVFAATEDGRIKKYTLAAFAGRSKPVASIDRSGIIPPASTSDQ